MSKLNTAVSILNEVKYQPFRALRSAGIGVHANTGNLPLLQLLAKRIAALEEHVRAIQEQVQKLAAENSTLKELAKDYADLADSRLSDITATCESDCRRDCYEECNKTRATDAFLREIRAQAVEGFVEFNRKLAKDYPMAVVAKAIEVTELNGEQYAARIRSGEQP